MRRTGTWLALLAGLARMVDGQDEPLVVGRDVKAPKKLYAPMPGYPDEARQLGVQGLILLAVTLGTEGRPTNITVL